MFEIQVLSDRGQWGTVMTYAQDNLVSGYTEDNRFATIADAEAAMKDLIANGGPRNRGVEWRVAEVMADTKRKSFNKKGEDVTPEE